MTSAGIESTFTSEDNPLELSINNEAFFLADTEPMGVVAEVIRNDMGDSLGVMVYDDTTRQVHKFRASQLVMRPDGNVTVLPSWFKKSREILRDIGPMEQAVPGIKRALKKGIRITDEQAVQATSDAPPEVQRFIDEAIILRSQLIGKLHSLFQKQNLTDSQLRALSSPGLFDRTPVEDRKVQIATLKRSHRLNLQTINAMRDFLVRLDSTYLFPKDPRYRALFKLEDFQTVQPTAPEAPAEEGVDEFETFEEAEEFETFEEADDFETFDEADDFETFEDIPEMQPVEGEASLPPPPPAPATASQGAAMPPAPSFHDVEALPDADEATVTQPSLMTVGAPGWAPPQPGAPGVAPMAGPATAPPPPPGAAYAVPPPPMPSMEEFEVSGQRKLDGEVAEPEPVAKKAGLLGRLRRGKDRQVDDRARAPVAPAAPPGTVDDFAPVDEFETFEDVRAAPPPLGGIAMPPPPSIPPPPSYTSHTEALAIDSFQEVPPTEEFAPVQEAAPMPPPPPVAQAVPAPIPAAPPAPVQQPAPAPAPPPMPVQAPAPAPVPAPAPAPGPPPVPQPEETFEAFEEAESFETFEEEVEAPAPGVDQPLDAEKDIDSILAMALGKAPAPSSRPTAKPGVRAETGNSMQSLLSKTKYRRGN